MPSRIIYIKPQEYATSPQKRSEMLQSTQKVLMASDTEISFETYTPDRVPPPTKEGETETDYSDVGYNINIDRPDDLTNSNVSITINGDAVADEEPGLTADEARESDPEMRIAIDFVLNGESLADIGHLPPALRVAHIRARALSERMRIIEAMCLAEIRHGVAGQESFLGSIRNGVISILDSGLHLLNIFKTYITRGLTDFKRSELAAFIDNHVVNVGRVYGADYIEHKSVSLPLPTEIKCRNLISPYREVSAYLQEAKMIQRVNALEGIVRNVRTNDQVTASAIPNENYTSVLNLGAKTNKIFARNNCKTLPFGEMYSSVGEFKETVNAIKEGDVFFYEVSHVYSALNRVDSELSLVDMNVLDKTATLALAHHVRSVADIMMYFGDSITMLGILNHHAAMHLDILMRTMNDQMD